MSSYPHLGSDQMKRTRQSSRWCRSRLMHRSKQLFYHLIGTVKQRHRHIEPESPLSQYGIADRWKCTICQSEPRFATTNVTRPLALNGCPSRTPVTVSRPVMTTAASDKTVAA